MHIPHLTLMHKCTYPILPYWVGKMGYLYLTLARTVVGGKNADQKTWQADVRRS